MEFLTLFECFGAMPASLVTQVACYFDYALHECAKLSRFPILRGWEEKKHAPEMAIFLTNLFHLLLVHSETSGLLSRGFPSGPIRAGFWARQTAEVRRRARRSLIFVSSVKEICKRERHERFRFFSAWQ